MLRMKLQALCCSAAIPAATQNGQKTEAAIPSAIQRLCRRFLRLILNILQEI